MNESEETEEIIKKIPSTPHLQGSRPCPTVSQYQLDALVSNELFALFHLSVFDYGGVTVMFHR